MTSLPVGTTTTPSAKAARQSIEEVANDLNTDPVKGLHPADIQSLRALYGTNELEADDDETLFSKFLGSFKDPLILLLLGSACISVLMGQFDDAISITMVNKTCQKKINKLKAFFFPLYTGYYYCSNRYINKNK